MLIKLASKLEVNIRRWTCQGGEFNFERKEEREMKENPHPGRGMSWGLIRANYSELNVFLAFAIVRSLAIISS